LRNRIRTVIVGVCGACPPHSRAEHGSLQCACDAGYQGLGTSYGSCTLCPAGTFKAASVNITCDNCVAGKYSATGATTCAPCPNGAFSPAGSSVCLQPYQIAHTPPVWRNSDLAAFAGVMQDVPGDWAGPDRQGTQYADGGDPSFYFILDLGASRTVAKLLIRNKVLENLYTTKTFSISMSIDSSTNNFGPQVTGSLAGQESSLQEVPVGLTGRYLKFQILTYGRYSAGLKYVAVVVSD
jgi:hypothetical protein